MFLGDMVLVIGGVRRLLSEILEIMDVEVGGFNMLIMDQVTNNGKCLNWAVVAGCEDRGEVGKDGRVFVNLRMCELGVSTVDSKKDGQMIPRVWRRTWWGQAEIPAGGRYRVIKSGKPVPGVVLSGSIVVFEEFCHCVRE